MARMNGEKNCGIKILTTSDIRKQAREWTLAGDVGLLAHLEKFSENLCDKTSETQERFKELVGNFEEVTTTVNNITNQFLALQNCQFVENRVYDEETPTEEKKELRVFNSTDQEKLCLMQYKAAVELGVNLLDTHFHEVHVPLNSDSEEDEVSADNSYIWKPKNPYTGKKFPLLIGSNEWWMDDYVGLGNFEDMLDTEKMVSDSESDLEYAEDKGKKTPSTSSIENFKVNTVKSTFSESSSEDLFRWNQKSSYQNDGSDFISKEDEPILGKPSNFSIRKQQEKENKNSKINSQNESQVFEKIVETSSENSFKVNNDLTKELEAKLAAVTKRSMNTITKEQERSLSITKNEEKKDLIENNIFDSTDDGNDLFSNEIKNLRNSNRDLFFDSENDDNLFSGSNTLFSVSGSAENDKTKNIKTFSINKISQDHCGILKDSETMASPPKNPLLNNLFEEAEDVSTIFGSESLNKNDSTKSQSETKGNKNLGVDSFSFETEQSKATKLFDEVSDFEDPSSVEKSQENKHLDWRKDNEILNTSDEKNKLRGTDFTASFEDILEKDLHESLNDDEIFQKKHSENAKDTIFSEDFSNKKNSLMKTEDKNNLFSSNLEKHSLFEEEKKPSFSTKTPPLLEEDDDTFLFLGKPKLQDSLSISSSRSSLFDEVNASKSRLSSVFEKGKNFKFEEDSLFGEETLKKAENDLFNAKVITADQRGKKSLLFNEFDESDDLFGSIPKKNNLFQESLLFENSNINRIEQLENKFAEDKNQEQEKIIADDNLFNKENSDKEPQNIQKNVLNDDDFFKVSPVELKKKDIIEDFDSRSKTDSTVNSILPNLDELEDNLFGTLSKTTSEPSFFKNNMHSLLNEENDVVTDDMKPKPPSTLSLKKEESVKNKNIGKLNIPVDLKFKFESMVKQNSVGTVSKEINENEDLDQLFEPCVNLLKCPSKDRVKIPKRRRPQSRRARQEAISKTSSNFSINIEVENSALEDFAQEENNSIIKNQSKLLFPSPVVSNPLSPSTDEEDCFNVPELDTNFEKEDHSIFKSNVFPSSLKVNDTLLFDSAPVLSPLNLEKGENDSKDKIEDDNFAALFTCVKKKTTKKEFSIFDDEAEDDSDDNLFKNQIPPKSLKKGLDSKTPSSAALFSDHIKSISKNKSESKDLFLHADLDDENDLFGKSLEAGTFSSKISAKEADENIQKIKEDKKKKDSTFVDPLGLISEN